MLHYELSLDTREKLKLIAQFMYFSGNLQQLTDTQFRNCKQFVGIANFYKVYAYMTSKRKFYLKSLMKN